MKRLFQIIFLFAMTSWAFAGTTGKISGKVTDLETGEPLIGVNIILEGTNIGSTTDADGYYAILNISPGIHSISASMIGYGRQSVTRIRVEIDRTSTTDMTLSSVVIEGKSVVVTAQREVIKMDVAANQRSISAESIEGLPVSDVAQVITLQAGVSGFSVRGGSSSETTFIVDGIAMKDERNNAPITGIPLSAINEISVQTGGFNAEYSNVRSGIVNVVTKEGSKTKYSGTFSIKHSPAAQKHFGDSPYNGNAYYLRPYLDPAVAFTGTTVGEPYTDANGNGYWDEGESFVDYNNDGNRTYWDKYEQRQYFKFNGWNYIAEESLKNENTDDDISPSGAQDVFKWEHRKPGEIVNPDYVIDLGFGGPVPLSQNFGNLRFYVSYMQDQDMYLYPVSTHGVNRKTFMLKMTSDLSPTMKLVFTSINSNFTATTSSSGGGTSYMSSVWNLGSAVNSAGFTTPWRLYTNDYWAPTDVSNGTFALKLTSQTTSESYYEIGISHITSDYLTEAGPIRDTSAINEIYDGKFLDEAPYGFWGEPIASIEGTLNMGGAVSTSRDYSKIASTVIEADYVNQIHKNNEIKLGGEIAFTNLRLEFGSINYFLPEGNYYTVTDKNPWRMNLYAQDKLEYEGFIAIMGLTFDYTDANTQWYDLDVYDESFFSDKYDPDTEYNMKDIKPVLNINPRLALSHPITTTSKLYFNYGHFRQSPTMENLYRIRRKVTINSDHEIDGYGDLQFIGDPSLKQPKTISYELGYDHALFEKYLIHISAYYKDISDQENWTSYQNIAGNISYSQLTAKNYEDIRGFEIEVGKNYGEWMTGLVNYEYRVSTSGYFGTNQYFESPSDQRDYNDRVLKQSKPRPQPRMKSVLNIHTPKTFGPKILGENLLGGWNSSFVGTWTAGSYFTYSNYTPGVLYNLRYKDSYNVDLQMAKTFVFGDMKLKVFADIKNLFNQKNFSGYGFSDGFDYDYYMQSLLLSDNIREEINLPIFPGLKKNDIPGDMRDSDVEFVPFEWRSDITNENNPEERPIYYDATSDRYMQYDHILGWAEVSNDQLNEVVSSKAYIDNPNHGSFIFLNPRDIFFGINLSYDF